MTSPPDRLLRRLEWHVIRRLDGRLQGAYRTVFRGTGIDFTDLRSYMPEDDVRHIDWNVTARLDEPYVRQYTEDRDLTVWLVLDRSASMRFGAAEHGKDDVLTELAVCLARLFSQGGNRVGAILYDNQLPAGDPGPHRPDPRPVPDPRTHQAGGRAPGRDHHRPRRHAATGRVDRTPAQPGLRHLRLHR